MKADKELYFFIGTEAELIKLYPLITLVKSKNIRFKIVASGQNDISKSPFLRLINGGIIDINICYPAPIKKSFLGLATWYWRTERLGLKILKEYFLNIDLADAFFVIHGDTVSTVMGSRISKKIGIRFAHIEAGYRSFNFLNPFPEEIDRYISSIHAAISFSVGPETTKNLLRNQGLAVDTVYNTVIETVHFALEQNRAKIDEQLLPEPFFVFVFHRQENLLNRSMCKKVCAEIHELSKKIKCVFIYHEYTKNVLQSYDLFEEFVASERIKLIPRVPYLEFIGLVSSSEFVITDGAGNQQEMFYLGKPCLLLRKNVEGSEGLGITTKLFNQDFSQIVKFYDDYKSFRRDIITTEIKPSEIILESIMKV